MTDVIYPEIVTEDFGSKWIKDLDNDKYHADKTAVSSTLLKPILLSAHAFHRNWINAQKPQEKKWGASKSLRMGSALHTAILEPEVFKKMYVTDREFIGETTDGRPSKTSKAAKEKREEWLNSLPPGAIVLSSKEQEELSEMINSVLAHNFACELLKGGVPEISGYYRDPKTGIKCRIRPDFFNFSHNALIDVKTCSLSDLKGFQRQIVNYRYDFQFGMYFDGSFQINGKAPENCAFIAVQNCEPFECCVYEADPTVIEKGYADYRKALDRLFECLTTKKWPRLQEGIQKIHLPEWALKQNEENV